MSDLADYLGRFDYAAVPLRRAATGHLFLGHAAINGRPASLCLDTGASRTVIDVAHARELGLTPVADGKQAGGAGSSALTSYQTQLASLALDEITLEDFTVHAIDLSHVNRALASRGEPPLHGVLGADLLDGREAVIDYKHLGLFLKRTARSRAAV